MMRSRHLPLALILTAAPALAAQSAWRLIQTTDELTAATDTRLILREDAWPTQPPQAADRYQGATLIVACGHRLPSSAGRTVFLSADQPMQPFGADFAYVEMRFDSQPQPVRAYFTTLPATSGVAVGTGRMVRRYIAFLGSRESPYFSPQIFARLLGAERVTITYRAFGADRTATFHLKGLRDAVAKLTECRWTE